MIRLNVPDVDEHELKEIQEVLKSGYLTQGPKVAEFEHLVAQFIGCKHAFAMSSCTTALHLCLVVLGVKEGDEVLVSDFTFPATANVIVQQGAVPVLVDIDLGTFTINPADLERKISRKTRAVIAVDTFGCSANWDAVLSITEPRGIPVIEDAACALGTTYRGRKCGNLTSLGCFSFHPRKVITTGEGGMITTNDSQLAERISLLRNHGGVRTGAWFTYLEAGFNYRMSDIQGAMGIAQMKKLPLLIERKRLLAARLRSHLAELKDVKSPIDPPWGEHIYQSFVVLLDECLDRDAIIQRMREKGIETTLGTYAVHDQPFFQRTYRYVTGQLQNSHTAFSRSLTLPLYPQMEDGDLDFVVDSLHEVIMSAKSHA